MKKFIIFLVSILTPLFVWFVSSIVTSESVQTWYPLLNKPFFNPPNWIFAPVWTILYFFIWYSFYKIWTSNKSSIKNESLIYYVHLLVNWLWSFIFFWLKNPWYALVDIIILWILIIIMIKMFYKTSKISSYLLCPYLAWVSFALILNMSIFLLN